MTRVVRAWGALHPEQRLAALASVALLITMFFPWYELQSLNRKTGAISSQSINAFGDVSFVEAAIFLVAVAVLVLLFARAERRHFHMPGSDGTIVTIAGGWAALLIFYRVFSRPDGHGYPVGIQWGFFLAFVAAGALTYAGWRMRTFAQPEPPVLRRRARHEDDPTEALRGQSPGQADSERPRFPPAPATARPPRTPPRRRASPATSHRPAEQLSLEDEPPSEEPR